MYINIQRVNHISRLLVLTRDGIVWHILNTNTIPVPRAVSLV